MESQLNISEFTDFDTAYRTHRPRIFRYIFLSLRDRDAAETLTQDCFLRAYRARHTFRGDAKLSTWLMKIARNLIRDHLRNRRTIFWKTIYVNSVELVDVSDRIPDKHMSPEQALLLDAKMQAVRQILPRLSPQQRAVFLLRFRDELDLHEIAEYTGLKEGTIKSHLYRALRFVRENIEQN